MKRNSITANPFFLILLLTLVSGCLRHPLSIDMTPDITAVDTWNVSFLLEQSVRFDLGQKNITLKSVIVKSGDRLDLVMLTPFGTKLLHIKHVHGDTHVIYRAEDAIPVDPEYILRDILSMFCPGCSAYRVNLTGTINCRVASYTYCDTFLNDQLVERTVFGSDYHVTVQYGHFHGTAVPDHAKLINAERGYTITALLENYREALAF